MPPVNRSLQGFANPSFSPSHPITLTCCAQFSSAFFSATPSERNHLVFTAKEWLRAWQHTANAKPFLSVETAFAVSHDLDRSNTPPMGIGSLLLQPPEWELSNACLSYRHDYGLMTQDDREALQHEARCWLQAWQKTELLTAWQTESACTDSPQKSAPLPHDQEDRQEPASPPIPLPALLHFSRYKRERDRAVGAILLLAYDGVISEQRARELLAMTLEEQRHEYSRLSPTTPNPTDPSSPGPLHPTS